MTYAALSSSYLNTVLFNSVKSLNSWFGMFSCIILCLLPDLIVNMTKNRFLPTDFRLACENTSSVKSIDMCTRQSEVGFDHFSDEEGELELDDVHEVK